MPTDPQPARIERIAICESCGEPHVYHAHPTDIPATVHRCQRCGARRYQGPPAPESDPLEELLDLREQEWDR